MHLQIGPQLVDDFRRVTERIIRPQIVDELNMADRICICNSAVVFSASRSPVSFMDPVQSVLENNHLPVVQPARHLLHDAMDCFLMHGNAPDKLNADLVTVKQCHLSGISVTFFLRLSDMLHLSVLLFRLYKRDSSRPEWHKSPCRDCQRKQYLHNAAGALSL